MRSNLDEAKDAVDILFANTNVELEVTYHSVTEVRDKCDELLEALEEDMENQRRSEEADG
jgi:hypothetical protein